MNAHDDLVQQVRGWIRGEVTWAQVEGMTPEEAEGAAQLGCELADSGRWGEAQVIFEGLVALNPLDASARAALGTIYQKLHRTEDAKNEYDQAIRLDPTEVVALANRGELRLRSGDAAGFQDLLLAIAADPTEAFAAGRRARGLVKAISLKAASKK